MMKKSVLFILIIFLLFSFSSYGQSENWESLNSKGQQAFNSGNYSLAQSLWEKAKVKAEKVLRKGHQNYISILNQLASSYNYQKKYDKAESIYEELLNITEEVFDVNHPSYLEVLKKLVMACFAQKKYLSIEILYLLALQKIETELEPNYASIMHERSRFYAIKGDYSSAEKSYLATLKIKENIFGKNNLSYAKSLNDLGLVYIKQIKYAQAKPLVLEALKIIEKTQSKIDLEAYSSVLSNLASISLSQGMYKEAESFSSKALEAAEIVFGKNNPRCGTFLDDLAIARIHLGMYKEAEPLVLESLKITEKAFGKNHPAYASILDILAILYLNQGNNNKAEPLLIEAKNITEKAFGKNHPAYAGILNSLASCYSEQGLYSKAELLFLEALKISKISGKNHPAYASYLDNLAELHRNNGRYNKVEPLLLESLGIKEKIYGKNNPEYAKTLNYLALLYANIGNYTKAETFCTQALKIKEKTLGGNHPDYARSLNNLANLYAKKGKFNKAESLLIESKNIFYKTLGENHSDYAISTFNLADVYEKSGNYPTAKTLIIETLEIIESNYSKDHLLYVFLLDALARIYAYYNKFIKAEQLFKKSLEIRKNIFGIDNQEYAKSLYNLAKINISNKNYLNAEPFLTKALKVTIRNNIRNSTLLSEKEKKKLFTLNAPFFNFFRVFVINYIQKAKVDKNLKASDKLIKVLQNLLLTTKAQLLDSKKALLNRIADTVKTNVRLRKVYEEYVGLKTYTSKVINLPLADQKKRGIDIAGNMKKINELEKELYKSIGEEGQTQAQSGSGSSFTFKKLQQSLQAGVGAIEMTRYRYLDKKNNQIKIGYMALITTKKTTEAPKLIILDNGDELENKFAKKYKDAIISRSIDKTSYKQFFEPIARYLSEHNIQKVYLSPDGVYNSINLNTLKNPQTGKYVEESYDIRMVSTLRDVLKNKQKRSNSGKAIALGRPDYNIALSKLAGLEKALKANTKATNEFYPPTSQKLLSNVQTTTSLGSKWSDLSGTEAEVKAIAEVLNDYGSNQGIQTRLGLGKEVHELAIKSIKRPKILHIATHGFFVPSEEDKEKQGQSKPKTQPVTENFSFDRSGPIAFKILSSNPMLRSGIALAGINSYDKANPKPTNIEDGILTAYEASQMDLRGTELVVLSACETGLGDVQNGEGVYGLQRAFIVAGAENVILSLWKVDDEATKKLMIKFYEEWIKNGKSKRAAFRAAQEHLKKEYEHPYYWGAFQFVGVE